MNITEEKLAQLCKFREYRYKRDSHCEIESYCSRPPRKHGYEPECKFQCCKEEKTNEHS